MRILKTLGGVANGWLKFFVTLAAVGWFGFNALDRYTEPEKNSPTPTEKVVTETSAEGEAQMTYTNMNLNQIKDEVTGFAKKPNTMVLLGLFSAFGLGLVSRPGLDWFEKKRRIRSAKKRAKRYEEDRQLLAEMTRKQDERSAA